MSTGDMIAAARKKAGLSQAELGEKIGVSGSMIGQWEIGMRRPKIETIIRIADALGTKAFPLYGAEDREPISWASIQLDYNDTDIDSLSTSMSVKILDEGTVDEFRVLILRFDEIGAEIHFDLDEFESVLKKLKGDTNNG